MKTNQTIKERIIALRKEMSKHQIDAYVIPDKDPHLSEIPPLHWQSRKWISGFSGSQGTVIITKDEAFLWTDSRYFLQAEKELTGTEYQLCKEGLSHSVSPLELLTHKLKENQSVGLDGTLFSTAQIEVWKEELSKRNISLYTSIDIFQSIWRERPQLSTLPVFIHPLEHSGQSTQDKIKEVRRKLQEKDTEAIIVTALDEIAWCLNLRGEDINYTPVFISYLLITLEQVFLFIDPSKITPQVQDYLQLNHIEVIPYNEIFTFLEKENSFSSILTEKQTINYTLYQSIPSSAIIRQGISPIPLLKAIRNRTEQKGLENAMLKDGIALVNFLIWLEENKNTGRESELSIEKKLYDLRKEQDLFISESFSTIAGYSENGAIVHYSATEKSNKKIQPKGFILIDSGAQYIDGTTDITRTIALGELSEEEKTDYTLVLKGHIALASAVFPLGTRGTQLDILARLPLWKNKLNFLHGTGHGVGHFLSVHEGPQSIRMNENPILLLPGMTITNEPGIYKENRHGVRTENVLIVREFGEGMFGDYLHFETLTLCPICTKGIIKSMLTQEEIDWLNSYHKTVFQKLSPHLSKEKQTWLKKATETI
ncbi:MAG: aminopeptidase P family protein [Bacteroidales bacterium]|nr:aminopeptidase P family protein [Bacteroidales bacterium]